MIASLTILTQIILNMMKIEINACSGTKTTRLPPVVVHIMIIVIIEAVVPDAIIRKLQRSAYLQTPQKVS